MVAQAPLVSILIVNWNGREHLPVCLESLAAQTFRDFEVILVDNGSTDGSLAMVREHFPWVRLVPLSTNTGFASGNNRGLEQARGHYIVTLNNDTRVEPDWLKILVDTAETHPRAGMVGCRICAFTEPDRIDSLGMGICKDGMTRGRFRNQLWSKLHMGEVEDILFPSACAALYKRTMLAETGFFDEDFFAYAEDSDLGLRGRLAGWESVLATQAVVFHKYSQTGGSFSPFKVYLVERNHYWVALKNLPPGQVAMLPIFTLVRYWEQARTVLAGSGTGGDFLGGGSRGAIAVALLRGIIAGLAGTPRMLGKRRQLLKKKALSWPNFLVLLHHYHITFCELLDQDDS